MEPYKTKKFLYSRENNPMRRSPNNRRESLIIEGNHCQLYNNRGFMCKIKITLKIKNLKNDALKMNYGFEPRVLKRTNKMSIKYL